MGLTSLHVCMDSSDWLQGSIHDDAGMDSSSPSGDMLACSRPLMERRLRPPHDQALKCPRCDSTHTKFCYYNNYSLSQPRYFCKTCRRYWTKGGTLRNIPVGGGCRKNKKASSSSSSSSSKKPNDHHQSNIHNQNAGGSSSSSSSHNSPIDLQLSIPEVQLSYLTNLLGNHGGIGSPSFMVENPSPIDFMESKYEALVDSSKNYDFMGNGLGLGLGEMNHGMGAYNFQHCCSPFGMMSLDDGNIDSSNNNNNSGLLMDTGQRLMLPYVGNGDHQDQTTLDVKPNTKLLSLEWQDQGCSDAGNNKDLSLGYINSVGSWSGGLMNGYGSSSTNPLV